MHRRRRVTTLVLALLIFLAGFISDALTNWQQADTPITSNTPQTVLSADTRLARDVLLELEVKGRAPRTGYDRALFSSGWGEINDCSIRELILQRDLEAVVLHEDGCRVMSGLLKIDPYTGTEIAFLRGPTTSDDIQIDHVVAVSDAWQKGAQALSSEQRYRFYNDPLNLLAVDGPTNNKKGDADAATWLPPNKAYRCRYVARQIAVKLKYHLWMTEAERSASERVLNTCPTQLLPVTEG